MQMEIERKETINLTQTEMEQVIAAGLEAKFGLSDKGFHVKITVSSRTTGMGMSESIEHYCTAVATREMK